MLQIGHDSVNAVAKTDSGKPMYVISTAYTNSFTVFNPKLAVSVSDYQTTSTCSACARCVVVESVEESCSAAGVFLLGIHSN